MKKLPDLEVISILKAREELKTKREPMNEKIKEFAEQAFNSSNNGSISDIKIPIEFIVKFAELVIKECANRCGSQADQRNLLKSFGFEVESNIKYASPEKNGSINSQYEREYNLPNGVTNDKSI